MKYIVSAVSPYGEPLELSDEPEYDPENAIIKWCRFSEKYPTCVSIQPETKEDGMKLLRWAEENFDKVEVYLRKHKCPYKVDWMKEEIASQVQTNTVSMQWNYDQLYPFCAG